MIPRARHVLTTHAPPLRYPLALAQERLWFLDRIASNRGVYNIPLVILLTGPLDVSALERALTEIVRRHEMLRTRIELESERPVQVVLPATPVRLATENWMVVSSTARAARLEQLGQREQEEPIDLSAGPLMRTRLVRLTAAEHILLVLSRARETVSAQVLTRLGIAEDALRAAIDKRLAA